MSSCSSNDVLCIGLSSGIVSVMVPYSCAFCKMCWAYADLGSLFFIYRMCSWNLWIRRLPV